MTTAFLFLTLGLTLTLLVEALRMKETDEVH